MGEPMLPIPRFSITIDTTDTRLPYSERKKNRPIRCGNCGEIGHKRSRCLR